MRKHDHSAGIPCGPGIADEPAPRSAAADAAHAEHAQHRAHGLSTGQAQAEPTQGAHDVHAGMHHGADLHAAARDMRRRFLVALAFTIPVFLWSPMGLMEPLPTPPGFDYQVWLFLLASGAVLYPGWKRVTQSLVPMGNKYYDVLELENAEGQRVKLYFDITAWMGVPGM